MAYIDASAGLMIFWMLFGHLYFFSHYSPFSALFAGCFMPWFFYKSGTFFKLNSQRRLLQKDTTKFLRTFFVYSLVGWIIWCFCELLSGTSVIHCLTAPINTIIHYGNIRGNEALWFLVSLFFVREIFNYFSNRGVNAINLAFTSYLIGFLLSSIDFQEYTWCFGNIFSGLSFFSFGYLMKQYEEKPLVFIMAGIFLLVSILILGLMQVPHLYMHKNSMSYGNYLLFLPWALAGIIFTNNFFRYTSHFFRFRLLEYIGTNALTIYVTHWILFTFITFLVRNVFQVDNPRIHWIILAISAIALLPVICYVSNTIRSKKVIR